LGWTWDTIDKLFWPQLMSLLRYWQAHPPLHILVQGIASGMAGKPVGRIDDDAPKEPKQHVESAEELLSILQSSGIPVGVIQQ